MAQAMLMLFLGNMGYNLFRCHTPGRIVTTWGVPGVGKGRGGLVRVGSRSASQQFPLSPLTALAYGYWNLLGVRRGNG